VNPERLARLIRTHGIFSWRLLLDEALGNLTLLEIGFETGLLTEEENKDNA
jgi:hypothetical protein